MDRFKAVQVKIEVVYPLRFRLLGRLRSPSIQGLGNAPQKFPLSGHNCATLPGQIVFAYLHLVAYET